MGMFSEIHWLIIAVVVFLLFGNRLPSVMRSLGSGISEFKKGMNDLHDEMRKGPDEGRERLPAATHGGEVPPVDMSPTESGTEVRGMNATLPRCILRRPR